MSSTVNTPRRGTTPAARPLELQLRPPRRGDHIALAACVVGFALFSWITLYLWVQGLITPESTLLLWLARISIGLTVTGFVVSLGYDTRRLWREERAIQFLLDVAPANDPLPELVARARALRAEGTLAGDLARRVDQASPGGQVPTAAELRGIASAHTAQLGGAARFISQLLLLLTVLGTFLGVREALPELVTTLGASTGPGSLSSTTLTAALSAVGDAFGSNLGALLGSIALGAAAYGLGAGRQAMLARLELASVQHVYPALSRRSVEDTDTEMLRQLGAATQSLTSLAGLTDAMKDLKDEVSLSSGRTARLLKRALRQERAVVLEDTRQQVSALEGLVTDVVMMVKANAVEYTTIAQALANRDRDFGTAVQGIGTVVDKLDRASDGHAANVKGMASDLLKVFSQMQITLNEAVQVSAGVREDIGATRKDLQTLIGNADALTKAMAGAEAAAERAREEAAERERTAVAAAERARHDAAERERAALAALRAEQAAAIAAAERHQRATLDRVEAELVRLLGDRISPSVEALRGSVDTLSDSVAGVRSGTEAGVMAAFRRAREERTGGGVDDLSSTLERISLLMERLDEPGEQLVRALERLARRIDSMESRMRQPIWKRLVGGEPAANSDVITRVRDRARFQTGNDLSPWPGARASGRDGLASSAGGRPGDGFRPTSGQPTPPSTSPNWPPLDDFPAASPVGERESWTPTGWEPTRAEAARESGGSAAEGMRADHGVPPGPVHSEPDGRDREAAEPQGSYFSGSEYNPIGRVARPRTTPAAQDADTAEPVEYTGLAARPAVGESECVADAELIAAPGAGAPTGALDVVADAAGVEVHTSMPSVLPSESTDVGEARPGAADATDALSAPAEADGGRAREQGAAGPGGMDEASRGPAEEAGSMDTRPPIGAEPEA
jgi:hypothetical protein